MEALDETDITSRAFAVPQSVLDIAEALRRLARAPCSAASAAAVAVVTAAAAAVAESSGNPRSWVSLLVTQHYHKQIGWTVPSNELLAEIVRALVAVGGARVCDYGSGTGVMTLLLRALGCPAYGVDIAPVCGTDAPGARCFGDEFANVFLRPEVSLPTWPDGAVAAWDVPADDVLLVCWGRGVWPACESYARRGGRALLIVGEDGDGCTSPPYDALVGDPEWSTRVVGVPNFFGLRTKLSVNLRVA